jgi:hypothetical protein
MGRVVSALKSRDQPLKECGGNWEKWLDLENQKSLVLTCICVI